MLGCSFFNDLGYDGSCGLITKACSKDDGLYNHEVVVCLKKGYSVNRISLVRGSYHFMHLTSSSPEQQADNFLDFIIYEKGDLPPVLDIEVADQARRIGVEETQERVLKWLEIVERKLGTRPIIYTSASMKKDFFDARKFSKYKFWIAHYRNEPPSDFNYLIWLCTDKGNIYGLEHTHKIDINIFNGTYRDFITLLDN